MRKGITFYEALWLVCFYYLISTFNYDWQSWTLLGVVIVFFPRWAAIMDETITTVSANRENKKDGLINELNDEVKEATRKN